MEIADDESDCQLRPDLFRLADLFSRHLWVYSSFTFLKTVTVSRIYSSSEAIRLQIQETYRETTKDQLRAPRNNHRCQALVLALPVLLEVSDSSAG